MHVQVSSRVAIGIVTFNNLRLLKRCLPSWRQVPGCSLAIVDNGSDRNVVDWLKSQPLDHLRLLPCNRGLPYARNLLIEYFRNLGGYDYILLADSDVLFHEGMVFAMLKKIESDSRIGIVGFSQANKGFPCSLQGIVEEIANECQLTRLEMWREIGLFPESVMYYSSDSWKSTIANMHGWKTAVIHDRPGYEHFQHGSWVNSGVKDLMDRDIAVWRKTEALFIRYWQDRFIYGKGASPSGESRSKQIAEAKSHIGFRDVNIISASLSPLGIEDEKAARVIVELARIVPGEVLEVGCGDGALTMQLAFNCPEKTVYAVNCTGEDLVGDRANADAMRDFCALARPFKNVLKLESGWDWQKLEKLMSIDMIILGSCIVNEWIARDVCNVLAYFNKQPAHHKRFIVWRGYNPASGSLESMAVSEFLRHDLLQDFEICHYEGTSVLCLIYPPVPDTRAP